MAGRIQQLKDVVKNMIAAGEVVEGPFSVLKELLENSIDANANDIYVEIEDSGFKKILVRDNGDGIYKEDIPKAILEHATSKIKELKDIDNILSYGFRGEALSSISSISKLTILSRNKQEEIGGKLSAENSKVNLTDFAGPVGTTIIVENLFYNTPARKKFLKSKSAEARTIKEVFNKIALSNPEITFNLTINGKKPYILHKTEKIETRLEQVFGKSNLESLYFDTVKDLEVEVKGFFSKPLYLKGSRSMQYLFVNNRPIDYKHLGFLLSRAYDSILQKGKYPAAIIYITIKPELVDVNIHPAKREIKFFDYRYIENLIYGLAKKILGKQEHQLDITNIGNLESVETTKHINETVIKPQLVVNKTNENILFNDQENLVLNKNVKTITSEKTNDQNENNTEYENIIKDSETIYNYAEKINVGKILGIIFGTYILVEIDDSLKVIDFHAAHERFRYDEILNKETEIETQELLFPETIELTSVDFDTFLENIDYFNKYGIDIDQFSETSVVVRGLPGFLKKIDVKEFILEIIESLQKSQDHVKEKQKLIAEKIACFSAKRANESLNENDIQIIVNNCFSGKYELRCPHGRPFIYKIDKTDFEKMFKR